MVRSATEKINLTKARIHALEPPESGRRIVYDEKIPGLGVRITPAGTKSFVLNRWIRGAPQIITLGRFPSLSVDKAREIAEKHNGQIADGINPMDRRNEEREELTFGEMFGEYLTGHAKVHKRTWEQDESNYDLHLKLWKNKKLSAIDRRNVQALHAKIGKEAGHYSANRILALLSTVFNHALAWGFHQGDNPAKWVKRFKEKSRERFLEADELPRFFAALNDYPDATIRDYVLFSLMTGARKGNVLAARWDQVELERGTWTIPRTKNDDPQTVTLSPEAVELLKKRKGQSDDEWVFPGRKDKTHLQSPKKAWASVLKTAEIKDLRIHDLRRTLGSWQAATGASLTMIGKSLGQKSPAATAVYARLNLDPVRESVNTAVSAMWVAGGLKEPAQVVPMKRMRSRNDR